MDEPLNLVLFSGTDDKLKAAAVLTAGAAALGRPVNLFLQYWALDAFRRRPDRPPTTGSPPRPAPRAAWRSTPCAQPARPAGPRRSARPRSSAGSTSRPARCRWTCSTSTEADLDPLVDGVEGVTAFYLNAGEGQVVFI